MAHVVWFIRPYFDMCLAEVTQAWQDFKPWHSLATPLILKESLVYISYTLFFDSFSSVYFSTHIYGQLLIVVHSSQHADRNTYSGQLGCPSAQIYTSFKSGTKKSLPSFSQCSEVLVCVLVVTVTSSLGQG